MACALADSACTQPACAGKDWCITHPIGQRCTDDQPTIRGRTSANFGYSKPLFACVHRTFGEPEACNSLRRRLRSEKNCTTVARVLATNVLEDKKIKLLDWKAPSEPIRTIKKHSPCGIGAAKHIP